LDINNRGQIIGHYYAAETTGAFLREPSGDFMVLERSYAFDINERGDVAGVTVQGAAIWRDGTVELLGVLPGLANGLALAINDRGQAVGYAHDGVSVFRAFLWDEGNMVALPSLAANGNTRAFDINNRGQTVGETTDAEGTILFATLWDDRLTYNLNELIRNDDPLKPFIQLYQAFSINNRGQIIANGIDSRDRFRYYAYLLTPTR
jgi:probable HAF family extracellular repeat protein